MRHNSGFTLIELLAAMGILALILTVAVPQMGPAADTLKAQAAAQEIAATLRATRAAAVASGRSADFIIDVAAGTFGGDGRNHHLPLDDKMRLALYTVDGAVSTAHAGTIHFYADGGASGGGVTIDQGDRTMVVAVDWLGGRISVREQTLVRRF